ncbi:hypothetical protein Pan44_28520 [Caulifigura coniformis]|uniref:Uncharacterized protein n=1 Tax=Caulifigura coniformis TaxID=2527983 RepID=A0A517SF94_9PLAN|nr:hypothetical protein [Caulifigura coniformis]QDT54814.1 hypothetical protein Pan44_28520 [Caulifigura coniformis]
MSSEPSTSEPAAEAAPSRSFLDTLRYGASLPERLVRSAAGLTAGTAKELAEFLVPRSFQDSKTYEVVVRNSLNFVIGNIGGVDLPADPNAPAQAENYLARKAVGNFMDFAGLATLHTSPLWVLAIVSDLAYGTKSYMQELARELQAQGLIDDASTIHKVDDLLDAVQRASGTAASSLDQPPLSVQELRASLDQTRLAIMQADPRILFPEAEIDRFWGNMKSLASQEEVSLLGVSGVVAMQTISTVKAVSQGTLTGVVVAGQLVNRAIFSHYVDSLARINEQGLFRTLENTYEPYVEAIWNNFHEDKRTWTESLLASETYRSVWSSVKRWVGLEKPAPLSQASPDPAVESTQAAAPAKS